MSRVSLFGAVFVLAVAFAPVLAKAQESPPAAPTAEPSEEEGQSDAAARDYIRRLIREELHASSYQKKDTFVPASGGPCISAEEANQLLKCGNNRSHGAGGPKDPEKPCGRGYCKTEIVPAARVEVLKETHYKKVTVCRPVPYLEVVPYWDPQACCWRKRVETKYRQEPHEVLVPYQKDVVREVIGHEELTVCVDDI